MAVNSELSRPRRFWALSALAAAALLSLGLGACGDSDDDSDESANVTTTSPESTDDQPSTTGSQAEGPIVVAKDFSLTSITVQPGTEINFRNDGEAPHTMTADDGSFDSGRVDGAASATVTAPAEPGTYPFHCELHPAMIGTLTVEG